MRISIYRCDHDTVWLNIRRVVDLAPHFSNVRRLHVMMSRTCSTRSLAPIKDVLLKLALNNHASIILAINSDNNFSSQIPISTSPQNIIPNRQKHG
jgi:hypothetical protein